MRLARIITGDMANGPGLGISVWFKGCHFHCKGCHNKELWPFQGPESTAEEVAQKVYSTCSINIDWDYIAILGGEPLDQPDIKEFLMHVNFNHPHVLKILWTGYKIDDPKVQSIKKYVDYIITEPYIESKRNPDFFSGSSNQQIYCVEWDGTCRNYTAQARSCDSWCEFLEGTE